MYNKFPFCCPSFRTFSKGDEMFRVKERERKRGSKNPNTTSPLTFTHAINFKWFPHGKGKKLKEEMLFYLILL